MSDRTRCLLLFFLYGVGAITTILILVPLLGVWLAVPGEAVAFGLFVSMLQYIDWK